MAVSTDHVPHFTPSTQLEDLGRRIKVCHLTRTLGHSRLEEFLLDCTRLINRDRFDVTFVSLGKLGVVAADLVKAGFEVREIGLSVLGQVKALRKLSRYLKSRQIDVLHTHNTTAQFHGAIAAKWAGTPIVLSTQHGHGCGTNRRSLWQFRIANEMTSCVFATSTTSTELCKQQNRTNAGKMAYIPIGVNPDEFFNYGPSDDLRAITVGKAADDESIATLIRATRRVVDSYPHFRLKVVGTGLDEEKLAGLARDLHLAHHVEFLREVKGNAKLFGTVGFYVTSNESDDANLNILEAMAAGLPILALDAPSRDEIVTSGANGRLVSGNNPEQIARGMLSLISERALWAGYGEESRKRILETFNLKRMVATYESVYAELAADLVHF